MAHACNLAKLTGNEDLTSKLVSFKLCNPRIDENRPQPQKLTATKECVSSGRSYGSS